MTSSPWNGDRRSAHTHKSLRIEQNTGAIRVYMLHHAMLSTSESSSSSSEDERDMEKFGCDGSSFENDDEEEEEVRSSHRSLIGMWSFPTPREYMKNLEDRLRFRRCIPRDLDKNQIAELFRTALVRNGMGQLFCER